MKENSIMALAHKLSRHHGWKLSESDLERLVKEAMPYLRSCGGQEEKLESVLVNYYIYSPTVRVLVDPAASSFERDSLVMSWQDYLRKVVCQVWAKRGPIPAYEGEDVVQSAWERILEGLSRFRYQSKLETWIYAIVVNTDGELRRRTSRQPEIPSGELPPESCREMSLDVPDVIIEKEQQVMIREAVIECLVAIGQTRKRISAWMKAYPQKLDGLARDLIEVLIGDLSQHKLVEKYPWSEPTMSRIIGDLRVLLQTRLRERNGCFQTSNVTETKEVE